MLRRRVLARIPRLCRARSDASTTFTPATSTENTTTAITTLPNGLRIASEPLQSHFVGVGAYIGTGSAAEPEHLLGCTHFLDRLSFKSTGARSRDDIMATIERVGGNVTSSSTRENIMYQSTIFRHNVEDVVRLFAEGIRYPRLTADEIEGTRQTIAFELEDAYAKPDWLATEMAQQCAFGRKTLGLPQLCTETALASMSREKIVDYRQRFVTPGNIVLAGVGVDHSHLTQLAEQYFGTMPTSTAAAVVPQPSAVYTGGYLHVPAPPPPPHLPPSPFTHFFLGFEGRSYTHPQIYALSVLQVMLGGGDSFSAGGPGKGMYSHFYTRILNSHHWVDKVQACNLPFASSGLFGVHCAVPAHSIPTMLEILARELQRVVNRGVSEEEVARAKNQLQSQVLMNLETRMVALEDVGRQVQVKGYRTQPRDMARKIGQVTAEQVRSVLAEVITQSTPTFVVVGGDKRRIPTLDKIQSRLGLGRKR